MKVKQMHGVVSSLCLIIVVSLYLFYFYLPTVHRDNKSHSVFNVTSVWQKYMTGSTDTKPPTDTDVKQGYLIYKCSDGNRCGGWTDRLKGIVNTYVLSNITNRRFGIHMNTSCSFTSVIQPAQNIPSWNITLLPTELDKSRVSYHFHTDSLNFYKAVRTMNFTEKFKTPVAYMRSNLDHIDDIKNNKLFVEKVKWMENLTRDQVYKHVIDKIFTLAPESQKILDEFFVRARPTARTRLVCAHVRRGRNPTIPNDSSVRTTDSDIPKVWTFLRRYNDTKKYKIFVTSDSEDTMNEARHLFPHQLVENKGGIIHIDKLKSNKDANCSGFRKVVIDQQILMKCDVLMICFSGFSRMAAYVRGKDEDTYCLLRNHTGIFPCKPSTMKELYNILG